MPPLLANIHGAEADGARMTHGLHTDGTGAAVTAAEASRRPALLA
jgi:hypothetical protein